MPKLLLVLCRKSGKIYSSLQHAIHQYLGPCGSLTITAKFDSGSDLKMFESQSKFIFDDIKTSFDFIQTNYAGVYIYTFEAENAATEITLN